MRVLLKRPRLVILATPDAAVAALVRREAAQATILRVADEDGARSADRVLRLGEGGALAAVEQGEGAPRRAEGEAAE